MLIRKICILIPFLPFLAVPAFAQDTIENYIREYPNQEQVRMMQRWLETNEPGNFQFTGLVDPTDDTVITPQATVNYGYNWFSLSEGPAIIRTPQYDRYFSVSIFDMKHNIPGVIVNPGLPILLYRPGQTLPEGDFHKLALETDQGLAFTRMVVVDNLDEVMALSSKIVMEGGQGDMDRDVQRFSPETEAAALTLIETAVPLVDTDNIFGSVSGDVGEIHAAVGVFQGQLGTPSNVVRYGLLAVDEHGQPFNGDDTYVLTVPSNIVEEGGYFSVTVYASANKLLIPNDKGIYDQTSYTAEPNEDGTYTVTLSPSGDGQNGIPTGTPFYGVLRAYVPVPGADLTVEVETK